MTHCDEIKLVFSFGLYEIFENRSHGFYVFYRGSLARCFCTLEEAKDDVISRSADEYYLDLACGR